MATNETYVDVPPAELWPVLADPFAYPAWVVGSKETIDADAGWPRPGAEFRVRVGAGPLAYTDKTVCREVDPEARIALHAGGGGVAGADVVITLAPSGRGTHVTMVETPGGISAPLRKLPPLQWLIRTRNTASLRRLRMVAEAGRRESQR